MFFSYFSMAIPVVILCGGRGIRMSHLTEETPKPMLLIGDKPILWHIMELYSKWGFDDFIICLGYQGYKIKGYFENHAHNFNITFVDTGENSSKSERLNKVKDFINEENFFLTYGDDLSNVDIKKELEFHLSNNKIATITAVKLISQFGIIKTNEEDEITSFVEKPVLDDWMNGGFMVINRKIFDYLDAGELESEVFKSLVKERLIQSFKHEGEWKAMNTLKDQYELNELWNQNKAFWKV